MRKWIVVVVLLLTLLWAPFGSSWDYCGGGSRQFNYVFWGGSFGVGGDVLMCRGTDIPDPLTYCPTLFASHEEMYGAYKWSWIAFIMPDYPGVVTVDGDGPEGTIRIGLNLYTYSATAIIAKDSSGFDYRVAFHSAGFVRDISYTNKGVGFALKVGWHYNLYP